MTESAANDRNQSGAAWNSSELDDGSGATDPSAPGAKGEDEILPVQFGQLEEPPASKAKRRQSRLNNVMVEIIVELGRTEKTVRYLTQLKENDVIDLDKLAGEPFDILINRRQFAEGEIVVVTDTMAVRITKLIERSDDSRSEEEE